jgi:hypothetical protein
LGISLGTAMTMFERVIETGRIVALDRAHLHQAAGAI